MRSAQFDTIVRQAARRRSIIGGAVGLVMAMAGRAFSASAEEKHHGGGHHRDGEKRIRKQCKKQARVCNTFWLSYCDQHYSLDDHHFLGCVHDYGTCCHRYKKCHEQAGDACIASVQY